MPMVAWQAVFYTPATATSKQTEPGIDKPTKQAAIEALMEIGRASGRERV